MATAKRMGILEHKMIQSQMPKAMVAKNEPKSKKIVYPNF
jgi:hypothetical protein